MAKVVEAVPSHWACIDGKLEAPKYLIDRGRVVENTGFAVERFHTIHPTIIGRYDPNTGENEMPDLYAIMVEKKLPGFIMFKEAGYGCYVVTFDLAERIAVGFLRKGYRGRLYFRSRCVDDTATHNPGRCDIAFEPWDGAKFLGIESGPQPARIRLEWDDTYGGKMKTVGPIMAACQSLNLREYVPVAPTKGATS